MTSITAAAAATAAHGAQGGRTTPADLHRRAHGAAGAWEPSARST